MGRDAGDAQAQVNALMIWRPERKWNEGSHVRYPGLAASVEREDKMLSEPESSRCVPTALSPTRPGFPEHNLNHAFSLRRL
eukprot:3936167-Rhodomonas_salina.1